MSDGQTILLTIESIETKMIDGKDEQGNPVKTAKMTVKASDGKKYGYFVNAEDGNFGQSLQAGKQVWVYAWDKTGTFKGKPITYHNIGKPRDETPPVPPVDSRGIPIPIPINPAPLPDTTPDPPKGYFDQAENYQPKEPPVPYQDKDSRIRWMNSITNATHVVAELIDVKKHGEPEIKNLLINYANFFNELEVGITLETLLFSKAQLIELHNRLTYHGISKLFYHEILEKILGKKVIKTTDLTYQNAALCLGKFDETLEKLNTTVPPAAVSQEPEPPGAGFGVKENSDEDYQDNIPF